MSEKSVGIGVVYRRSAAVHINLLEVARCGFESTVVARFGGRSLVTQIVPEWWLTDVRASGVLDAPVRLGLRAVFEAARDAGLLCIDVAATATSDRQAWVLQQLSRHWGDDTTRMWSVPWSSVGLHLGRVRLPAPPEMLVQVPIGDGVRERLEARERALDPYIDRVLWGDPGEAVERVIAEGCVASSHGSIPLPLVTPSALKLWEPLWRPVATGLAKLTSGRFFLRALR